MSLFYISFFFFFDLDVFIFSTIKTIQDKKFNNTIVTYVTTMKVMTKTMTTIVTKNGQIASIALSSSPECLLKLKEVQI